MLVDFLHTKKINKVENKVLNLINKISQEWFLAEPLLFSVFCTHELVENQKLSVPFRTGKLRIEYNPIILENFNKHQIQEYLKIECFRILLKHPYQRQPLGAKKPYLSISSDAVIHSTYSTDVSLTGIEVIKDMIERMVLLHDGFSIRSKTLTSENHSFADAAVPLRIPASSIADYLKRHDAIDIVDSGDEITAKIDKDRFAFLRDDDFYQVMKYNSLLQKYENVYGIGLFQFWREHIRFINNQILLPKNLCFEEWYSKILTAMELTSEEGDEKIEDGNRDTSEDAPENSKEKQREMDNLSDVSELWQEDDQTQEKINNLIDDAEKSEQWGSVSGDIKELIQANKKVEMNYAEILRHFSTSIIASKRSLTRMKPNRRFGFDRLGSRYNLSSNLLIAVDVSSSITKENLEYVFSIINQFFRYGVEKIDVIQFDETLHGNVMEMSRAVEYIQISGRGGTDFQPAADFYCQHHEYDGMIYFTDGFGPHPEFKGRNKVDVLWIFTSKFYFDKGQKWANLIPGNISTFIPLN